MVISNDVLIPTITGFIGIIIGTLLTFISDILKERIQRHKKILGIFNILKVELKRYENIFLGLQNSKLSGNILFLKSPLFFEKTYFDVFINDLSTINEDHLKTMIETYESIKHFEKIRNSLNIDIEIIPQLREKEKNNGILTETEKFFKLNETLYCNLIDSIPQQINKSIKIVY